ncbi:SGNH/GDSL hydrolase family protein [Ancylobacter sp.]|uniref:SGNH/GDSL hydrolase family protein n=1 Tax=Ancylobacter sp. TaxID=1872567 RepID=UPI003D10EA38
MRRVHGYRIGLKALAVAGALVAGCSLAQAQSDWFRPPGDVGQPATRPSQQQQRPQQRQQARPQQQQQQRAAPQVAEPRRSWSPFQPLIELFGGNDNRPRRVRPPSEAPVFAPPPPVVAQPPADPRGKVYDSVADARGSSGDVKEVVLVFGDEQAGTLAQGLADAFAADRETAAVVSRSEADAGFAPGRRVDLIAAARQLPTGNDQANVIVVFAGGNDLQAIDDPAGRAELFDERWRDLYSRRFEDFLLALKLQRRTVVVVGLPPVEDSVRSEQIARYNALLKEMVERSGFIFVDVTDGFVDENGKFMMSGPAVDGQRRRLRNSDGVGFTRAGARKLAFFVDQKLDDLLSGQDIPAAAADPADARPSIIMLTGGAPAGNARTLAGAPSVASVNDIGRAAAAEEGKPEPASVLVDGAALPPVVGRTDDFRWPAGQPTEPLVPAMPQTPLPSATTP